MEKENKLQGQYHVCIHNWKKETQIVNGPNGVDNKIQIYCKPLTEFMEALKGAEPGARFIEKKAKAKKSKKMKEGLADVYKAKKWLALADFTYTMEIPHFCANLKKFDESTGRHDYSKCK